MSEAKISVIVPVYNVEKYIAECMGCLVGQTLQDIEIICVDDCGTDKSMEIVERYASQDSRIKIVRHPQNMGLSASRNTGIQNSTAPYIMFCDSDDFYCPCMCEKMLNGIMSANADMAMCGTNIIYEANEELRESDKDYYDIKFGGLVTVSNAVVNRCDVSAWNKIFKRAIFDTYGLQFPVGLKYEDAFFFRAYALWAKDCFFIKDKLYNYRRRAGSIMNQTFKKESNIAIDHLKIAIEIFKYLSAHDLYKSKYAYFWMSIFIPYFNFALWNTRNRMAIRDIFSLAAPFVAENYHGDLDVITNRILRLIANRTLNQTQKYLGGVIAIKDTGNKKIIRFCGIPVWQIKYLEGLTKYYFAGVQICIQHR